MVWEVGLHSQIKRRSDVARQKRTLSEIVVEFYLKAPLAEIEGIQSTLRAIYKHRKGLAIKSKAAVIAGKRSHISTKLAETAG